MAAIQLDFRNHIVEGDTKQPVAELVSGIFSDAQTLISQQVHMLAVEFREDMDRTKETVQYLGIGIGLFTAGGVALLFSLVYFLTWLFPEVPIGASWAIVGCFCLGLGVIFLVLGQRVLDTFSPLPKKTLNALQENLSWLRKRLK